MLMPEVKCILLLDVGLASLGVAVVTAEGDVLYADTLKAVCPASPGMLVEATMQQIRKQLRQLDVLVANFDPSLVLGEFPHGGAKSAKAAKSMNMATAMITAYLYCRDLRVVPVKPSVTKDYAKAATGGTDKKDVQRMVEDRFGDVFGKMPQSRKEHAADALALYFFAEDAGLLENL